MEGMSNMTLKEFKELRVGDKVIVFGTDRATVSQRFSDDVWVIWDETNNILGGTPKGVSTRFNCYKEDAALFAKI
jgi:hypothetical protein